MPRIRVVGLGLMATFAVSAVTATRASAEFKEEPPEYGQCLPKPFSGIGAWKDAGCRVPSGPGPTEHKYEWYPGFGENGAGDPPRLITKLKFTSKIKRGTLAVFEVDHIDKVSCTGEGMSGEITGPKTVGSVIATFTGCTEVAGNECQTKGQPAGRVLTAALEGELGVIKSFPMDPGRDQIGLNIFVEGVEFECVGIPVQIDGSVIHQIAANAMKLTSTERFVGAKGQQKPARFAFLERAEQEPAYLLYSPAPESVLSASIGGKSFEASSLSLTTSQRNEMKIEVSSIM